MMCGRSLVLGSLLVLAVGVAPAGAQSPAPDVSQSVTAAPSPSATLEPGLGPVGMPWVTTTQVRTTRTVPEPRDVTAWSGGFARLEGRRVVRVRLSVDGTRWSRRFDVGRLGVGARIAPFGGGLIVVGAQDRGLVAWTSADGRRWQRMAGPPLVLGDGSREVSGFADQLVTVGERTLLRGGVECPEALCPEAGLRLWGVTLGGGWETLPMQLEGGRIRGVFPGRGRFLATVDAGQEGTPDLLVASQDGRRWRRIGTLDDRWANLGVLVGETRDGFVAVDPWLSDRNGGGSIRTSADGSTWSVAWQPTAVDGLEWSDLALDGDTAVAVGTLIADGSAPISVGSVDGGVTWSQSSGWPSTAGGCFRMGAVLGKIAIAAGDCGPAGRAWVATIPGVPDRGVGPSLTEGIDPAAVPFRFDCRDRSGLVIRAVDLADAPDVRAVDPQAAATVDRLAAAGRIPVLGWRVLGERPGNVVLVRANVAQRSIRPFRSLRLFRSGTTDVWGGGGGCARAVDQAIGEWDQRLRLDTTRPAPTATTRVLHLVTEGCPGQRALRPSVTLLARDVLLQVPITGSRGDVCRAGAIRFQVRLREPLGDRRLWDASYLPLRPIRR